MGVGDSCSGRQVPGFHWRWHALDLWNNRLNNRVVSVSSKGRGFREPRRRGFDDDDSSPSRDRALGGPAPTFVASRTSAPAGPTVRARVKWFNPEKGFGFVSVDGSSDAFLHAAVLERSGHSAVLPGATLEVRIGQSQKGPQVSEVLEVDVSTVTPEVERGSPRQRGPGATNLGGSLAPTIRVEGTVKWFSADKGFGFIGVASGGKDVFVHISALQRSRLASLTDGQRVIVDVRESQKGPEAETIRLSD